MFVVWFMCFCEVGGCAGAGAAGEELRLCIGIGTVKAGGCGGAMEDSLLLAVLLMERELARVSIIISITPYSTPPITPSLPSTRHHRELYKSPEAYCEGRIL